MKTARVLIVVLCIFGGGAIARAARVATASPIPQRPAATANRTVATEQEWIVGDVVRAIAGMARNADSVDVTVKRGVDVGGHAAFDVAVAGDHQQVVVVNHIWSPQTYAGVAQSLLNDLHASAADEDLDARRALTDLRVDVLLAQNRRISDALAANMRSAAAHESAALLVGALALGESSNFFGDVRPALSRMAAHLALARGIRGGQPASRDGALAMVMLTDLAGLQRDALQLLDAFGAGLAPASPDLAWVRALRLRITGDWRPRPATAGDTLIERLEYARAVRDRRGVDAFLDYVDTLEPAEQTLPDWHRLAMRDSEITVEGGHRFANTGVDGELVEATRVWSTFHTGTIERESLIAALNDRPSSSPVIKDHEKMRVDVLDWGTWAAFHQRRLLESLALNLAHAKNMGIHGRIGETLEQMDASFGDLTLYPVVEGWIAENQTQYEDALARTRPVVDAHPELLTAPEWNYLLKQPAFVPRAVPFRVNVGWFDPAVPEGTAFDLQDRSLQPGCPRPPTLEQAAWFGRAQPYDEWTVWAATWLTVKEPRPSSTQIRRALGSLVEYDDIALKNFVGYIDLNGDEKLELLQRRCSLAAANCPAVGEWLVLDGREGDALATYERMVDQWRDEVGVANNLGWIVRYYRDHGKVPEAGALAVRGARTQSYGGLDTLADLLDAGGHYKEAEEVYRMIAEHYEQTAALGTFLVRRAMETHDKTLELKALDLLRTDFPNGLERAAIYALDVEPTSGVTFVTFGRRPASFGFQPDDLIVAVDGWRVRNWVQYRDAARLSRDESMTFIVWRKGQYREIRARVPQRWLGVRFMDYRAVERVKR